MKSFFIPLDVFNALKNNPKLSIEDIEELANVAYSTAARYKNFYIKHCNNLISVHHNKNKVVIAGYTKLNEQYSKLKIFLDCLLNSEGFESSQDLRNKFYNENPEFKNQKNRNFNRYFRKYRDEVNPTINKLKICGSNEKLIGFCTRENIHFKPTDN